MQAQHFREQPPPLSPPLNPSLPKYKRPVLLLREVEGYGGIGIGTRLYPFFLGHFHGVFIKCSIEWSLPPPPLTWERDFHRVAMGGRPGHPIEQCEVQGGHPPQPAGEEFYSVAPHDGVGCISGVPWSQWPSLCAMETLDMGQAWGVPWGHRDHDVHKCTSWGSEKE